ncbi:restriction endonuclease subunit S [Methyloradius palustris]|uniref:Type I restriction modification system subunit S n=1 Tax=Methyloradius palustris TaxID=2778876 RepID=A0A8D5FXE0_9PROT|nr:restriction endonuclease subunit S [Methyloradius palustris]BCM23747.1 type I restriction modification system subunit S [Methyloradius palustris]
MKAEWQLKTLGEVCEVVNGGTPKTGVDEYWGNEHLWITPAEMGRRATPYVNDTERKITSQGLKNSSARLLPPNSVILSSRAPIGHLVINTKPMATNQGCKGLVPNDGLAHKYLFYFLMVNIDLLNDLGSGATFKELSGGKLKEVKIRLAPPPEQQRIVAILDKTFEGIAKARANAEQNLQNARALFESHLQSVFTQRGLGWSEKKIGDVCDLVNGFAFKSSDVVDTSQTQLVRMGNLYGNNLSLDRSPVFYPDNFSEIYRNYLLVEDDLIMSLTGTTGKEDYGYTVKIPKCSHALLMNQRIVKFEILNAEVINRNFLMYYLRSRVFLDKLYLTANGTRQANLSSLVIKTLPLPICSTEKQLSITTKLDVICKETQRLEILYQRKITCLDELKKSLLQQAFAGEL